MRDRLVMGRDGQQADPLGGSKVTRAPTKRVARRRKKGEGRAGGKGESRCSECGSPKSALLFLGTMEKGRLSSSILCLGNQNHPSNR